MNGLGVENRIGLAASFTADSAIPVGPGAEVAAAKVPEGLRSRPLDAELIQDGIDAAGRITVQDALRKADALRAASTLVSLARAYEMVGERESAGNTAREAMELAVERGLANGQSRVIDPISLRLAVDVLLRSTQLDSVQRALKGVDVPRSVRLSLAVAAATMSKFDEALALMADDNDPVSESFRGFFYAAAGRFREAIPHLRSALREMPDEADTALNLSISLLNIGARKKAITAALRATRSSPGRQDASLHYLELLFANSDFVRLDREFDRLRSIGIVPSGRYLVLQGRSQLARDDSKKAISLLEKAAQQARVENDESTQAEVLANLAALKRDVGTWTISRALSELTRLQEEFPESDVVVVKYAQLISRTADAPSLRRAIGRVESHTLPARLAYLNYQLAYLEGDNEAAKAAAANWLRVDPSNQFAMTAAVISSGIGMGDWDEAAEIATRSLSHLEGDSALANNAAYVLAMAGRPREAIDIIAPHADESFVYKATLGLAYLANGDVDQGMRLYRRAAEEAEKSRDDWSSLMTTYQALIVRQLKLDKVADPKIISALSLPPVPLPVDWTDRPEFVRLWNVAIREGYDWPLAL